MEVSSCGKFRLCQLHGSDSENLNEGRFKKKPISDGLVVECKSHNGDHYSAIAFIKNDISYDGSCCYEAVGSGIEDSVVSYKDTEDFRSIVKYGFSLVKNANMEENKNERN